MIGRRLLAIAALAACAVTAGCRQQGSAGAAPAAGTSAAATPSAPAAGTPTAAQTPPACTVLKPRTGQLPGTGQTVTLTNADNGKSFCLKRGTRIYVFLRGTEARKWTPLQVSSASVARRASGVLSLMVGETGGYFQAVHAGAATLTSVRGPCRPDSAGQPGFATTCTALSVFRVTLVISG